MSDIFISYSREDSRIAGWLAGLLQKRGYSVWWDQDLYHGEDFRARVIQQIKAAKAVIVIWTDTSVGSLWVISEAQEALRLKKLVPVRDDGVTDSDIPMPFATCDTGRLTDVQRLLDSVAVMVAPAKVRPVSALAKYLTNPAWRRARIRLLAGAAVAAAFAVFGATLLDVLRGRNAQPVIVVPAEKPAGARRDLAAVGLTAMLSARGGYSINVRQPMEWGFDNDLEVSRDGTAFTSGTRVDYDLQAKERTSFFVRLIDPATRKEVARRDASEAAEAALLDELKRVLEKDRRPAHCASYGCSFTKAICAAQIRKAELAAGSDRLDLKRLECPGSSQTICASSLSVPFSLTPGRALKLHVEFADGATRDLEMTVVDDRHGIPLRPRSPGKLVPAAFLAFEYGTFSFDVATGECTNGTLRPLQGPWEVDIDGSGAVRMPLIRFEYGSPKSRRAGLFTKNASLNDRSFVVSPVLASGDLVGPFVYDVDYEAFARDLAKRVPLPTVQCGPTFSRPSRVCRAAGGGTSALASWLRAKSISFGRAKDDLALERTVSFEPRAFFLVGSTGKNLPFSEVIPDEWENFYYQVTMDDGTRTKIEAVILRQ
jgi:hypothetical protein